jgi:hypothetical protein
MFKKYLAAITLKKYAINPNDSKQNDSRNKMETLDG